MLPCPTCIFSHPSCSTGVNSAGPVSLDMVMFDRTQCPVCRVTFARGMARPHYQEQHSLYARWADRWFISLMLFMASATIGYYFLGPAQSLYPEYCSSHISSEGWSGWRLTGFGTNVI